MLRRAFLICVLMSVALANETKPDKYKNVKGCYISELDMMIPYNGVVPSRASCMEYVCAIDGSVTTEGCPPTPPNCRHNEHKGQPYPLCCAPPSC